MSTTDRPAKAYSCIRCFERKVKCDKQNPCSNCVKSKVDCVFRIPPAPRRRKKRPQEELLLARLKKCEDLLKSKGISIDSPDIPGPSSTSPTDTVPGASHNLPDAVLRGSQAEFYASPDTTVKSGQLIVDHGKSRFIENNLWTSVSSEFQQPNDVIAEYSEDEDEIGSPVEESTDFLLGYTPTSNSIQQFHPSPDHIFVLWQVFLENINPMTKVIHQPTLQETLVQATSNLDNLPKGLEALMFSIYCSAVFSMGDDECEMKFGETRKVLLARYRHATRKALGRARFMGTSDPVVLQAFLFYLLTMREDYDSRTVWTLSGVASRVGQAMGIHRDGTLLGLPPFETEMRRRLWWQISILDFRSAELSGSGRFGEFSLSDTQLPSNVNDADIYPGMTEPPVSQTRPTEMVSCLLRAEFGHFWKEKLLKRSTIAFENLRISSPWTTTLDERDASINELEQRIEEKFLRYCDPSIPIQFLAVIIGRAAVHSMRLMAHHPRKYSHPDDVPASEREYLWHLSVKLLESDNLAHSSKGLHRFMWHSNVYFQWQAFIYILNQLKTHTIGDEVDKAWQQVDEIFHHHPKFVTDSRRPLHVAVGSLCLKAYDARERALREKTNGVFPKVVPEYIQLLREQRRNALVQRPSTKLEGELIKENFAAGDLSARPWQDNLSTPRTYGSQISNQAAGGQLPLPTVPQPPMSALPVDAIMDASDPNLAQDLGITDMPMDWAQWDYMIQDFDLSSR
ncbi:uncharacterized protein Z518_07445 [Rhinocladiella mackenziei CBS 650.93]|uniref:Zn(2)-C6 fungal-type domain-containing protein n=1 Tax=Rhinocladiella mackenziei CBS 650.93 TaxID=1442369 RepID=A0A0D2FP34_9EURO|nr:uncharacterized protein Z518_07445 [Rhinocladiella mackenziei CBS 650.93]KIX03892.1 hypothetical protein Z518_07445 [Rhinocladiella mackenziei CBS 650.93]